MYFCSVSTPDVLAPYAHKLLQLYVPFSAVSASALLDSGASHYFIAAPQLIKFINNVQKSISYPGEPIEVHLADNSSVISD